MAAHLPVNITWPLASAVASTDTVLLCEATTSPQACIHSRETISTSCLRTSGEGTSPSLVTAAHHFLTCSEVGIFLVTCRSPCMPGQLGTEPLVCGEVLSQWDSPAEVAVGQGQWPDLTNRTASVNWQRRSLGCSFLGACADNAGLSCVSWALHQVALASALMAPSRGSQCYAQAACCCLTGA